MSSETPPVRTTISQKCTAETSATDVIKFRVSTTVVHLREGDLPHEDIFVHSITKFTDPKSDRFMRIASIIDLTKLPRGREAAVRKGGSRYLQRSFEVDYDDIDTATTAKELIQSRVDSLISSWITYTKKFLKPDAFEVPLTEAPLLQAAIAAHEEAKKVSAEKELAADKAAADLEKAQEKAARASQELVELGKRSDACKADGAKLELLVTALRSFDSACGDFVLASDALSPSPGPPFSDALANFKTALAAYGLNGVKVLEQYEAAHTDSCGRLNTEHEGKITEKARADVDVATATTRLTVAEQERAAAKSAEDAALAAALDLCPTYKG